MKYGVWVILAVFIGLACMTTPTYAQQTLRIQPLEYRTSLAAGETKKGFIDITNPEGDALTITMSVKAFRQVDSEGRLEFYDDERIRDGIKLDYDEFELKPGETIRLFFVTDGSRLPSGDVFAAIFATTRAEEGASNVRQALQTGTLLSIVNGTPGARDAIVSDLDVPFFQIGPQLTGRYTIKNLSERGQVTGFYPSVSLSIQPLQSQHQIQSRLVFAGQSRTNEFAITDSRLGLYKLTLGHQDSRQSTWVFMATGVWAERSLFLLVAVILAGGVLISALMRRRSYVRFKKRK